MGTAWHLAQINVARLRHPREHPASADFVAALEPINALADAAPGFVWRLQSDTGDATDIRVSADALLIVNMSVWESIEALSAFVYESAHVGVMRRRRDWFERATAPSQALWWTPAGRLPSTADGMDRLDVLRRHGSSPTAFTFQEPYPTPSEATNAPDS